MSKRARKKARRRKKANHGRKAGQSQHGAWPYDASAPATPAPRPHSEAMRRGSTPHGAAPRGSLLPVMAGRPRTEQAGFRRWPVRTSGVPGTRTWSFSPAPTTAAIASARPVSPPCAWISSRAVTSTAGIARSSTERVVCRPGPRGSGWCTSTFTTSPERPSGARRGHGRRRRQRLHRATRQSAGADRCDMTLCDRPSAPRSLPRRGPAPSEDPPF